MAKRNRQSTRRNKADRQQKPTAAPHAADERAALVAHPPAKNPTLLAISMLLFAVWLIFLLVTALMA